MLPWQLLGICSHAVLSTRASGQSFCGQASCGCLVALLNQLVCTRWHSTAGICNLRPVSHIGIVQNSSTCTALFAILQNLDQGVSRVSAAPNFDRTQIQHQQCHDAACRSMLGSGRSSCTRSLTSLTGKQHFGWSCQG